MTETELCGCEVIQIGENSVDQTGRLKTPHGDWQYLTSLEAGLLTCLYQHVDQSVSISELLRQVWRCSTEGGGTAAQVKNCVWRLRHKLEPHPSEPQFLLSKRGRGYLLNTTVDAPSS